MASGTPMVNGVVHSSPMVNGMGQSTSMVNGELPCSPGMMVQSSPTGHTTLQETLEQMNILIQENRELKEALRGTNLSMKERFEELSSWKEKQREERDFLERKLEEARGRIDTLTKHTPEVMAANQSGELEALRAQVRRLQAEKNDLVAMNSELQLKAGQQTDDESFIEIRIAEDGKALGLKDVDGGQDSRMDLSTSRLESEEMTVSQLLQSLRMESQRAGRLQIELQASKARITELEQIESGTDCSTQTSLQPLDRKLAPPTNVLAPPTTGLATPTTGLAPPTTAGALPTTAGAAGKEAELTSLQEDPGKEKAASEVENLKGQMMALFKELQQAQSKLDDAENMKKNLQERVRDLEQELVTVRSQQQQNQDVQTETERLKLQLDSTLKEKQDAQIEKERLKVQLESMMKEKQMVQTESERIKLQLESMVQQNHLEQRKSGEERTNLQQLKEAYTKLFEDYEELKDERKRKEVSGGQVVEDLQARLVAAEQALATKQQQIDGMKQELYQKEKELETISVFQAQAEVYSSDFYAERAAREKIHEERERLAAQLEFVKQQNTVLQEEMESLGRQSLSEMQRRHVPRSGNPHGGAGAQGARGGEWHQQVNIPEHACPKCSQILPDLDSLQIHIMDCII